MAKIFTAEENAAWAKQLPGKMTSACVAIRHNGAVLMVKAKYKDHWTFPSGIVDDNESPKRAALRETREETGLVFSEADCALIGVIYTASDGSSRDRFNFGFTVGAPSKDLTLQVPNDEIEEAKWVEISEVGVLSGDKESYKNFQAILLDEMPMSSYIEVYSTTKAF